MYRVQKFAIQLVESEIKFTNKKKRDTPKWRTKMQHNTQSQFHFVYYTDFTRKWNNYKKNKHF